MASAPPITQNPDVRFLGKLLQRLGTQVEERDGGDVDSVAVGESPGPRAGGVDEGGGGDGAGGGVDGGHAAG